MIWKRRDCRGRKCTTVLHGGVCHCISTPKYSRTPLIRPPSESYWCGRIRGMVARKGFVYEQKPLSVTRNVVVWEGWSLVRVVVRQGFYCTSGNKMKMKNKILGAELLTVHWQCWQMSSGWEKLLFSVYRWPENSQSATRSKHMQRQCIIILHREGKYQQWSSPTTAHFSWLPVTVVGLAILWPKAYLSNKCCYCKITAFEDFEK